MSEPLEIPSTLKALVKEAKEPIEPHVLDILDRFAQIHDRRYQLHTFIDVWREQQNRDRMMRGTYATWLLIVVSIQIIVIYIAFFMIGFGILKVEPWVANVFIAGVFVETSSLVLIVVKYLFPEGLKSTIEILDRISKEYKDEH